MSIVFLLVQEMEQEASTTRKMLALVPADQFTWKPHPKSMSLMQLSTHVAEIPGWVEHVVQHDVLDFMADPYQPTTVTTTAELVQLFEKSHAAGKAALQAATDVTVLNKRWAMKAGEQMYMDFSKYEAIRHSLAQNIHHRAQLGVYLRLLNIPIPGSYGPSADEQNF